MDVLFKRRYINEMIGKALNNTLEYKIVCLNQMLGNHKDCSYNPEENERCPFGYSPIKVYLFRVRSGGLWKMVSIVYDEIIIIRRRSTVYDVEELTDINQHLHDCIYWRYEDGYNICKDDYYNNFLYNFDFDKTNS